MRRRDASTSIISIRCEFRALQRGRSAGSAPGDEPRSDIVQKRLAERGVASTVYYPVPLHLQPLYASLGGKPGDLRVSERASREVLSIPIYPEMAQEQIQRVAGALREAL